MSSGYKYLGIGLAGGIAIAAALILGMAFLATGLSPFSGNPTKTPDSQAGKAPSASSIFTATSTPTDFPTITPYPTIVLSPTPTLTDIERMLSSGQLILTGPLSKAQQILLYESSLEYIAPTPLDSLQMAKQINGVEYGNPANTCGPLAMAIMRDAGLVSADTVPHDFWLLNPWLEDDRRFLNETLLPEKYAYFVFHAWLKNFDWRSFPLQPGDFLYIKAGAEGNFDHMLVVSRVDRHLRAYAVTNYQMPNGFVIDEVLLYDPADPNAGIFGVWTGRPSAKLGTTGFGGFEVWRPKSQ